MNRSSLLRAGWIDQILAMVGSVAAAYSSGVAVSRPEVAVFFAIAITLAGLINIAVSLVMQQTKFVHFDSVICAVLMISCVVFARKMNLWLPERGYPSTILIGGVLSWMLLAGSIVAWRDQTLLFQTVPCIALFGFVGSWDTFVGAIWLFFVFLICAATLFARGHMRSMIRRAELAGVTDIDLLRKGPWRWMAGPEWALFSALGVVVLSIAGAPAFQFSVQGMAGAFHVDLPSTGSRFSTGGLRFDTPSDGMSIGRGPASNLSEIPVLNVKLPQPMLLRGSTLGIYDFGRWRPVEHALSESDKRLFGSRGAFVYDGAATLNIPVVVPFEVTVQSGVHQRAYIPGEYRTLRIEETRYALLFDGTIQPRNTLSAGSVYRGEALIANREMIPIQSGPPPAPPWSSPDAYYSTTSLPISVQRLAQQVTAGKTSDYQKALAIKEAIAKRCTYDLDCPATPQGRDPVEFFLFTSRRGYCDLFASAQVMMSRAVGLPSRYVTGFLVEPQVQDGQGFFQVKDSDYHAWSETFFPGSGWVSFDATEDARTAPGSERGGIVQKGRPWYESGDYEVIVNALLGACAIGLVLILVWPSGQKNRSPRAMQLQKLDEMYTRYQLALNRITRKGRHIFETPTEYLTRVESELGMHFAEATALGHELQSLIFSGKTPEAAELQDLNVRIKTLSFVKSERLT